jgi:hypothetical protein
MKFSKFAHRDKARREDPVAKLLKDLAEQRQKSKDEAVAKEQAEKDRWVAYHEKLRYEEAERQAAILSKSLEDNAFAQSYGLTVPYSDDYCMGVKRPYRYTNACLKFHIEMAKHGGWLDQEGGSWLARQWNKRQLKVYLKERAKWEENPVEDWDKPSIWWKICKVPLSILAILTVLACIGVMLILAFAFPIFGVMMLMGGALGTMGGNGDMPEKS